MRDEDDDERPRDAAAAGASTRTLAIMTGIITAMVGLNTLVVSCTSGRLETAAREQRQAEVEEQFWLERFRELDEIQGSTVLSDKQKVQRVRFQVRLAAARRINQSPMLNESMRRRFAIAHALDSEFGTYVSNMPPPLGAAANDADYGFTEAARLATAGDSSESSAGGDDVAITTNATPYTRQNLIQLSPSVANRWDFDIFWCASQDEAVADANFRIALRVGEYLRDANGTFSDERFGRVRVRVLPVSLQGRGYPQENDGLSIGYDRRNADELALATEVANALAGEETVQLSFLLRPKVQRTRWYLSMFICGDRTAPRRDSPAATPAK